MNYLAISDYRSLLKVAIVVTPLLAVTWVVGVLAINEHTSAFVWMFAILSSIQVLNTCQYCMHNCSFTGSLHVTFLRAEK